jgi:hypothetical protein
MSRWVQAAYLYLILDSTLPVSRNVTKLKVEGSSAEPTEITVLTIIKIV